MDAHARFIELGPLTVVASDHIAEVTWRPSEVQRVLARIERAADRDGVTVAEIEAAAEAAESLKSIDWEGISGVCTTKSGRVLPVYYDKATVTAQLQVPDVRQIIHARLKPAAVHGAKVLELTGETSHSQGSGKLIVIEE